MAHLLARLGAKALLPRRDGDKLLPPLIGAAEALRLREQFYAIGQQWPYENIVPGKPPSPPGCKAYLERQKAKEAKRAARAKQVAEAMANMPKTVADYKVRR